MRSCSAFESGSVDAWVIWDPFQAAAEKAINARVLADGSGGVVNNYQYYLAARDYASANGAVIDPDRMLKVTVEE